MHSDHVKMCYAFGVRWLALIRGLDAGIDYADQ